MTADLRLLRAGHRPGLLLALIGYLLLAAPVAAQKQPRPVPGRLHLLDGRTRAAPLVYVDYNKVKAVENGVETVYTPLEVSSFVVAQDSFVVLRDFTVAIGPDEQEFRIAFVRVGVVGPGFALYHFRGTMRQERGPRNVGPGGWGPGGMLTGSVTVAEATTEYNMSQVWFMKLAGNPQWVSLSDNGTKLKRILQPVIADDKQLEKSVSWTFLKAAGVQEILRNYLANKTAAAK